MSSLVTQSAKCLLSEEFFRDLDWWVSFLKVFNGFCPFHDSRPVTDLHTDACSSGIGAAYQGDWFYSNLLVDAPNLAGLHINFKEALCVVFSLERWAESLRNKVVHIHCNNQAAVAMLNKGTTRNPVMMTYLRRLFWCSARYNFRLRVFYVPGKLNVLADHMSRLHFPVHLQAFCRHLLTTSGPDALRAPASPNRSVMSYFFLFGLYSSSLCFSSAF